MKASGMRASISSRVAISHGRRGLIVQPLCAQIQSRNRSTDAPTQPEQTSAPLNPRWLSDVKQRIGNCMKFGLSSQQVEGAGVILQEIARDWRELVAGSDGFLTSPHRRTVHRRRIVWGEQDSMVCISCSSLSSAC